MQNARVKLIEGPTPLEHLQRMSDSLGIRLLVKRDDLAGTTMGGNKSRQLEYYLGAALEADADTILITGAVQSNFVRTAVASAARYGMRTIVQLENRVLDQDESYHASGNVFLNQMLGAEVMYYEVGEDEDGADTALRARAEVERAKGRRPYVIPLALGNPPLGALGYMRAAEEIVDQVPEFDFAVVGSGSGLTHTGLLMGLHQLGHSARVIGSCVRRPATIQHERIKTVLHSLGALLPEEPDVPDEKVTVWDGALAPGYGQVGPVALDMMKRMSETEGFLLDPVYTAKSFAAIPALVETGDIPKGSTVVFVHTGGLASLFAYQTELQRLYSDA